MVGSGACDEVGEAGRNAGEDIVERMVAFHAARLGASELIMTLSGYADGQVNKKEDVMVIDSAHNDCFDAYYAKPPSAIAAAETTSPESVLNSYFDGSASWFTSALILATLHSS